MGLARSKSGFKVDEISPAKIDAINIAMSRSGFFQIMSKSKTIVNGLLPKVVKPSQRMSGKAFPLLFIVRNRSVLMSKKKIKKAAMGKASSKADGK